MRVHDMRLDNVQAFIQRFIDFGGHVHINGLPDDLLDDLISRLFRSQLRHRVNVRVALGHAFADGMCDNARNGASDPRSADHRDQRRYPRFRGIEYFLQRYQ